MPPPTQIPNSDLPILGTADAPKIDCTLDAATNIYATLTEEGFSIDEKLAVRKQLDQLVRQEIDTKIAALQQLRSSF